MSNNNRCWECGKKSELQLPEGERLECSACLSEECWTLEVTWDNTTHTAKEEAIRFAPGSTTYRMFRGWYHSGLPVHSMCDRIWCRIHLKTWVTSSTSVPLGIRVYSMNKRPGAAGQLALGPEEAFKHSHIEVVTDRDDIAGSGSYITFAADLKIRRGQSGIEKGMTYLAIAYAIDPAGASGNDANARFEIAAFHAIQMKSTDTAGGLTGPTDLFQP